MLSLWRLAQVLAIAVTVAVAAVPASPPASAQGRYLDYSEFYEALEPFGRWFEHPRWGLVWWPYAQQDEDWRPYSRGQWLFTDDHGWYWDSDEEWGWATYHFGRWLLDERYGWLWVPGNEWGPAWVAWREDDEYIGWAPLAPGAIWDPGYGVRYVYAEYDTPYWAPIWCFVSPRYLLAPRVWYRFAPRSRNAYLLGRTRHVTKYALVGGRIHNRSIDVRRIARITRGSIPVVKVRSFNSPREIARRRGDREFVGIYRPKFNPAKQNARFAPRLTAPDAIENARRTRTTLRNFGPGDKTERERSLRSGPSFKDSAPSPRNLPSGAPPTLVAPGKGPPPEDNRRSRERSVGPPAAAIAPLPQAPSSGNTSRSLRNRTWDKSPSANIAPPPGDAERSLRNRTWDKSPSANVAPPPGDAGRSLRNRTWDKSPSANIAPPPGDVGRNLSKRSYGTSGGPPPSGSVNRRIVQPQSVQPGAGQPQPQYQIRSAPPPRAQTQGDQSRGSQRGNRRRDGKDEGQPQSLLRR